MTSHVHTQSRSSLVHPTNSNVNTNNDAGNASSSTSASKQRQYTHLHAQLAQLSAQLADTENLVRMTAVQALDMRFLGGYVGALLVGGGRVLGERSEGVAGATSAGTPTATAAAAAGDERRR